MLAESGLGLGESALSRAKRSRMVRDGVCGPRAALGRSGQALDLRTPCAGRTPHARADM